MIPNVQLALVLVCQLLEATLVIQLVELAFTNKDKDALSRLILLTIRLVEMALLITLITPLIHQASHLHSSGSSLPCSSLLLQAWSLCQSNIFVFLSSRNMELLMIRCSQTTLTCSIEASKWEDVVKEMKFYKPNFFIPKPLNSIKQY